MSFVYRKEATNFFVEITLLIPRCDPLNLVVPMQLQLGYKHYNFIAAAKQCLNLKLPNGTNTKVGGGTLARNTKGFDTKREKKRATFVQ